MERRCDLDRHVPAGPDEGEGQAALSRGGPRRETPRPTHDEGRSRHLVAPARQGGPSGRRPTRPASVRASSRRVIQASTTGRAATATSVQAARSPAASHRPTTQPRPRARAACPGGRRPSSAVESPVGSARRRAPGGERGRPRTVPGVGGRVSRDLDRRASAEHLQDDVEHALADDQQRRDASCRRRGVQEGRERGREQDEHGKQHRGGRGEPARGHVPGHPAAEHAPTQASARGPTAAPCCLPSNSPPLNAGRDFVSRVSTKLLGGTLGRYDGRSGLRVGPSLSPGPRRVSSGSGPRYARIDRRPGP